MTACRCSPGHRCGRCLYVCAICADECDTVSYEPLGKRNALVAVCVTCSTETAREVFGPELQHTGGGPSGQLAKELTVAMRRVMGDAEYDRLTDIDVQYGLSCSQSMTDEERMMWLYDQESRRRFRTGLNLNEKTSVRRGVRAADSVTQTKRGRPR